MLTIRNRNENQFYKDGTAKKPNYEYRFETAKVGGKRTCVTKAGFKTKKECEVAGLKAYNEYINGYRVKPSEMSINDLFDYWLNDCLYANIKDTTYKNYKSIIDIHLRDHFGRYKVTLITPQIIQAEFNRLAPKYSKGYMHRMHVVMRSTLEYARKTLRIIAINPMQDVDESKKSKKPKEVDVISKKDLDAILKLYRGTMRYYLLLTTYYTGARSSEVMGLTWDKIDLESKTITIDRIVSEFKFNSYYLTDTKTEKSTRVVRIGDTLVKALRQYKKLCEANERLLGDDYIKYYGVRELSPNGLDITRITQVNNGNRLHFVFVRENGFFNSRNEFKVIHDYVKKHLDIDFHAHSLRHTHATMLIEGGAPVKSISERLGHSDITITLQTYVHDTNKTANETCAIFEKNGKLKNG